MVKIILLALLAGCATFQDPNIVVDLRVLAMRADVCDQVIDVDFTNPPPAATLLAQLVPATVCALVADPNFDRQLRWSMVACNLDANERCDDGVPQAPLGSGVLDDPDITEPEPAMCATLPVDGNLLGVLLDVLDNDPLQGLGGLYYGVSLRVGGADADPDLDLYAAKELRVSPRIPPDLRANNNPYLQQIQASINNGNQSVLELGRCIDFEASDQAPLIVAPEDVLDITPIEPAGVREVYVAPTVDGGEQTFTETLTYQWTATNGSFSSGSTGGPPDLFGNPAPLDSEWTAPTASAINNMMTDVPIWVVQRDERLGVQWYETCIRVMP